MADAARCSMTMARMPEGRDSVARETAVEALAAGNVRSGSPARTSRNSDQGQHRAVGQILTFSKFAAGAFRSTGAVIPLLFVAETRGRCTRRRSRPRE